ncbi:hypothetical protein D3C81_2211350 [compost metagenome]
MPAPLARVPGMDVFGKLVQFGNPGVDRVGIDVQRAVPEEQAHGGLGWFWIMACCLDSSIGDRPVAFTSADVTH